MLGSLLLGSLFLGVLLRQMPSHHAAANRPDNRMVPSIVTRYTAHDRRRSVSPPLRASEVCMSTQNAQPLICDARRRTSSVSDYSRPLLPMAFF